MMMRKVKVVVALILISLVGAWFLFLSYQKDEPKQLNIEVPAEMTSELEPEQKQEIVDTEQPSLTPEELLKSDPGLGKARTLQDASHSKIEFYGQVIDQFGEPVEGATVNYSYTYYPKGILPAASWSNARGSVMTDAYGRFEIKDHEGIFLSMKSISKSGYQFRPPQGLGYIVFTPRDTGEKRHIPDPNNPVQIPAWKKTETARELKRGEQRKIYRADGQFRELPISESKDAFQIAFENLDTTVSEDASDRSKWRVHLKANGGGLIETNDAFTFEAPEAGYLQDWEAVSEENRDIEKTFYIKTPDGNYGRLNVKLIGYYGNDLVSKQRGYIRYQYTLNPTGSRNLLSDKD